METVIVLGILLLGSVGYLGHQIEMLRQSMLTPEHLEKTKRSIKDSMNYHIDKKLSTPVEVDEFIENVIQTFRDGGSIGAYSEIEKHTIWNIAIDAFQREPFYRFEYERDGLNMKYKKTVFTYNESDAS